MQIYDAKKYWSKRLDGNIGLNRVGFPHFGEIYNNYMYKMKRIVLERTVSKYRFNFESIRILDLGCGNGFYVDIWHTFGAKHLVGIDITNEIVKHLSAKYTKYEFYEADIASSTLINDIPNLGEKFDLITAFDVLFHVVDDNKFEHAIKNIRIMCEEEGYIFVTDVFPHQRPYNEFFHHKSRLLTDYIQILGRNGIEIVDRIPVHYFANAPLDISNMLLQKILLRFWWEKIVRIIERKTRLLGPLFFGLDLVLTRLFKESPSTEMIICEPVREGKNLSL